jgi:hypothetical protein
MYLCIFEESIEVRRKDASIRMDCSMFCPYASKIDLDIIAWMVSWDLIGVCIGGIGGIPRGGECLTLRVGGCLVEKHLMTKE